MNKIDDHACEAMWRRFDLEFPSEASSLHEICSRIRGVPFSCPHCQSELAPCMPATRAVRCGSCKKSVWITARTFFHRIRKPRAWHGAIYLLQNGTPVSASKLHKLAAVSIATASGILKKIMHLLSDELLKSGDEVASLLFRKVFGKRSRETPCRAHPRDEENHLKLQNRPDSDDSFDCTSLKTTEELDRTASSNSNLNSLHHHAQNDTRDKALEALGASERKIYELISAVPISSEQLCQSTGFSVGEISSILIILEIMSLVKSLPGDCFMRAGPNNCDQTDDHQIMQISDKLKAKVDDSIRILESVFGAISRKYLQHYLGFSWFMSEKSERTKNLIWITCSKAHPTNLLEILTFVSPANVRVA